MPDNVADFWSSYDPSWGGDAGPAQAPSYGGYEVPGGGGDINPAGAASDPFGYTNGSLLTPWGGHFDPTKYGTGGGGVAPYTPFRYNDFNFQTRDAGQFNERYDNPGQFVYGDYKGQQPFAGVSDKDLRGDKGYQFTVDAGMKALQASKAAQGVLKTGGTGKALMKYGQDMGSQQYDKVYGRKLGEYQMSDEQNRFAYGTNRGNAKDSFDSGVTNNLNAYNTRLGAFAKNADVTNQQNTLNYQVAQGTWDRNEQLARQGWQDNADYQQRLASAGAAAANQAYERGLQGYTMARDEFWTNQDRQYAILDEQDNKGRDAAYRYGDATVNNQLGRGNAAASGVVGSANANAAAANNVGNYIGDIGLLYASRGLPRMPTTSGGK